MTPVHSAANIKQARQKLKMSQESLARRLGISFTTINRWENGRSKPSPLAAKKLQSFLKMNLLTFKSRSKAKDKHD